MIRGTRRTELCPPVQTDHELLLDFFIPGIFNETTLRPPLKRIVVVGGSGLINRCVVGYLKSHLRAQGVEIIAKWDDDRESAVSIRKWARQLTRCASQGGRVKNLNPTLKVFRVRISSIASLLWRLTFQIIRSKRSTLHRTGKPPTPNINQLMSMAYSSAS